MDAIEFVRSIVHFLIEVFMEAGKYEGSTVQVEQQPALSVPSSIDIRSEFVQSGTALVTVTMLVVFLREIRLLIKACKDS